MMKFFRACLIFLFTIASANVEAQTQKLWYQDSAHIWNDALPIGNGSLGAMIYGGAFTEHLQFNEETLWTSGPRNYSRPDAWKYLDSIRHLLANGKQKEAEALGEAHFMGMKSPAGDLNSWYAQVMKKGTAAAMPGFNDKGWKTMPQPSYDGWEAVGFEGLDAAVWLRKSFYIEDPQLDTAWRLDLNRVRDYDHTYINGQLVGSQQNMDPRLYRVPSQLLHKGMNTIAVLVLNSFDKGGIAGYKDTTRKIGLFPASEANGGKHFVPLNGLWKYFITDNNPPDVGHYEADYQPFGDLYIEMLHQGPVSDYRRELDLKDAIASTRYVVNGVEYRRTYLASKPDKLLLTQLNASKAGALSFRVSMSSPHRDYKISYPGGDKMRLSFNVRHGALHGVAELQVVTSNGRISVEKNGILVSGATTAEIRLVAATNFKSYKDISGNPENIVNTRINEAARKTADQITRVHLKEYQSYYDAFSINLGPKVDSLPTDKRLQAFNTHNDPDFVALYIQYGRYLLISSSRPGSQPANLQGIWNDKLTPPWGSKYTTNINLEMNYWPAEVLNLPATTQPLFQLIKDLQVTGAKTAWDHYHARGWVLHHNTDLWRGTAPINASNHGIWVSGAAWLCEPLWEHYLYHPSQKFLSDTAWPAMKGAAMFFKDFLVKDPKTGYYISTPSNSPEHGGLVAGPAMDHQIIRSLFMHTVAAAHILHRDERFADSLQAMIPQIAPSKIGRYGQLQEWMEDKDDPKDNHRHVSHLWAVYPGNEINWRQTPELLQAAKVALEHRGDEATGWSLAWKINLWARFRDGDHALKLIRMLLRPTHGDAGSYNNLFDAHPPFQIDGNFGAPAGIAEMLVQTHTGLLDILPALPMDWTQGQIKGMRARGDLLLDFDWKEGRLVEMRITSGVTQDLPLKYGDLMRTVHIKAGQTIQLNASLQE